MKRHIVRSLKYMVKLIVLIAIIFAAMMLTKTTYLDTGTMLAELFLSTRGALLLAALLVVAGTYPLFGFVKRDIPGDLEGNADTVVNTMAISGYTLTANDGGVMVFRAASPLKRFLKLWDDEIRISGDGRHITIEGDRKEAVKAEYRLRSFIR